MRARWIPRSRQPGRYQQSRLKALEVARYAIEQNLSFEVAAKERGGNRHTVQKAGLVLRHATAEEIAEVEAGKIGIVAMARKIAARGSPERRRNGFSIIREKDLQRRAIAIAGARLVLDEHITIEEAANRLGMNTPSIQQTLTILKHGTDEDLKLLEEGGLSLKELCRRVRARQTLSQQNANDRVVWKRLLAAFDAIVSMPRPHDVIGVIRKHHVRRDRVERQLGTVYAWLEEFSDAWTKK